MFSQNVRDWRISNFDCTLFRASSSMSFFEAADETDQKDGIAVDRIPIQRKTSRKMRRHRRRLRQHFAEQLNETAPCENGGNFVNGKCECHFPFVGPRCVDFACGTLFPYVRRDKNFRVQDFVIIVIRNGVYSLQHSYCNQARSWKVYLIAIPFKNLRNM